MKELVETIARSLVNDPEAVEVTETLDEQTTVIQLRVEAVEVTETLDEQTTVIQLRVAADDMGKVIGKQGRIAKALRTVVKAAATKAGKKVVVEIVQ